MYLWAWRELSLTWKHIPHNQGLELSPPPSAKTTHIISIPKASHLNNFYIQFLCVSLCMLETEREKKKLTDMFLCRSKFKLRWAEGRETVFSNWKNGQWRKQQTTRSSFIYQRLASSIYIKRGVIGFWNWGGFTSRVDLCSNPKANPLNSSISL